MIAESGDNLSECSKHVEYDESCHISTRLATISVTPNNKVFFTWQHYIFLTKLAIKLIIENTVRFKNLDVLQT